MKKVLITGCEGFVGRYLVEKFSNEGVNVEGSYYKPKPHYDIPLYFLDIRDKTNVKNILQNNYDVIIHLAAQSSGAMAFDYVNLTYEINENGTLNLLDELRKKNKPVHFIYVSTAEVYGIPKTLPLKESDICNPINHYAVSKCNAENIVNIYNRLYENIHVTIVRPFNHTGPYQRDIFVLPSFAKQIARIEKGLQEPVIRTGDLSVKRDFMDVRDVVNAYYLIYKGEAEGIFNISSGKAYTISQLLNTMINLSGMDIEIKRDSKRLRPVDIPCLYGDASRIKEKLNWQQQYSIEDTIKDLLNYWRTNEDIEK